MIDQEKITALSRAIVASEKPRLLFITHAWGGGIERHVIDLISMLSEHVDVLLLRGFLNGGIELAWHRREMPVESLRIGGFSDATLDQWVNGLHALGFSRVHLHHTHGWPPAVIDLIERLDLPLDVTLHDYASICPQYHLADEQGRYCGEPDAAGCEACIAKRPHSWGLQIGAWRERMRSLLARADRVIAPTQDVGSRITRYYREISPLVWSHAEAAISMPQLTKVVLLGGLSPLKGLHTLREVAALANKNAPQLAFRLIGHAAEPLPVGVTTTGSYDEVDLPRLLASERADVIWFPAQVPETYSYTLSVAIASGVRIVATDLGSFRERLATNGNGLLVPLEASAAEWITALLEPTHRELRVASKGVDNRAEYAARYLSVLEPSQRAVQPDTTALSNVLVQFEPPVDVGTHGAIDIFRVGRYGGHRASLDVIEREIERLDPRETGFVGSTTYQRTANDLEAERSRAQRVTRDLHETEFQLIDTARQLSETRDQYHAASRALDERDREVDSLRQRARDASRRIEHLEAEFARITQSRSWKVTRPLRGLTALHRASPRLLRGLGLALIEPARFVRAARLLGDLGFAGTLHHLNKNPDAVHAPTTRAAAPVQIEALQLRTTESPKLSIVIPVYEQHETTFACLRSIAEFRPSMPHEVIVMDDASPTAAADALAMVEGVRFVRNDANLGFLGNVNRGAFEARGEWLLILNNDTLLTACAIDAMVNTFRDHENVGLVGAKLLNADGTLQEAGGILWRDGSAWNWGRGQHPDDPRFNFVRDADYCSGAAIAVRRDVFLDMGGFDPYFAPAYYEDTDLAFRMRARGLRVLYQPHAAVYHLEGVSHGRDQSSGIKAYQVTNAAKFFDRWHSELANHRPNGELPQVEARRGRRLNILIVEAFLITPDQDSGSLRLLNIMRLLISEGHHVTFVAENLQGTSKYREMLESNGIEVLHGEWAQSIKHVLRQKGSDCDVIMLCRHYVAAAHLDAARLYAPRSKILFDTVDLHFLREEREAKLIGSAEVMAAAEKTKSQELSLCRRVDATLVVSGVEKRLLAELVPKARVEILSNVHRIETERPPFDVRSGVLFVGGFRHPPNVDAVKWYAQNVLPILRAQAPEIVTQIVGSNMPSEIEQLEQPGLKIVGFVEELKPVLRRARVSIAPLRYGAGVKGKVNEAMNFGIPVVATPLAVEGMHLTSGVDCLVAEEPEQFAAHVIALYRNEPLWTQISKNALASVQSHFSMETARAALQRVLSTVTTKT